MNYAAIPKLIVIGWFIMLKDKMNKYKLGGDVAKSGLG